MHMMILFEGVILWFMIRNIYLVFVPISSTELLKPWGFLEDENDQGISCYVNEMTFGMHLRMGAGYQGNQPVWKF